jgi:predicted  nucleic acid-binding Zn-ribbon protein
MVSAVNDLKKKIVSVKKAQSQMKKRKDEKIVELKAEKLEIQKERDEVGAENQRLKEKYKKAMEALEQARTNSRIAKQKIFLQRFSPFMKFC